MAVNVGEGPTARVERLSHIVAARLSTPGLAMDRFIRPGWYLNLLLAEMSVNVPGSFCASKQTGHARNALANWEAGSKQGSGRHGHTQDEDSRFSHAG